MCGDRDEDMVLIISYILRCGKFDHITLIGHLMRRQIIVGTIVTRSPSSTFAPRAFYELQMAIELFEQTAKQSSRARTALVWFNVSLHKLPSLTTFPTECLTKTKREGNASFKSIQWGATTSGVLLVQSTRRRAG